MLHNTYGSLISAEFRGQHAGRVPGKPNRTTAGKLRRAEGNGRTAQIVAEHDLTLAPAHVTVGVLSERFGSSALVQSFHSVLSFRSSVQTMKKSPRQNKRITPKYSSGNKKNKSKSKNKNRDIPDHDTIANTRTHTQGLSYDRHRM